MKYMIFLKRLTKPLSIYCPIDRTVSLLLRRTEFPLSRCLIIQTYTLYDRFFFYYNLKFKLDISFILKRKMFFNSIVDKNQIVESKSE